MLIVFQKGCLPLENLHAWSPKGNEVLNRKQHLNFFILPMKYPNRAVLLFYPMPISTWEKISHHLSLSNLILRYPIQEHFLLIIVELLREAQFSSRVHGTISGPFWLLQQLPSQEKVTKLLHTHAKCPRHTSWQSRSILLRVGKKIKSIYRVWHWREQETSVKVLYRIGGRGVIS